MAGGGGDITMLPEGCISHVISLTSPRDCCRLAVVSPTIKSVADSDIVWDSFLPPGYEDILSRAVDPVVFSSKKDLYFRLCDSILIDGGKMCFRLERSSGRKCFMLSARGLRTVWASSNWLDHSDNDLNCLTWDRLEGSRFPEVAQLLDIRVLEIGGSINSKALSRKTTYAAYLVFKLPGRSFNPVNAEASVKLGSHVSEHTVCLLTKEDVADPEPRLYRSYRRGPRIQMLLSWRVPRVAWSQPQPRADGWMETELGEFFNYDGGDGDVEICLVETKDRRIKAGLIVEGIEVRPK